MKLIKSSRDTDSDLMTGSQAPCSLIRSETLMSSRRSAVLTFGSPLEGSNGVAHPPKGANALRH